MAQSCLVPNALTATQNGTNTLPKRGNTIQPHQPVAASLRPSRYRHFAGTVEGRELRAAVGYLKRNVTAWAKGPRGTANSSSGYTVNSQILAPHFFQPQNWHVFCIRLLGGAVASGEGIALSPSPPISDGRISGEGTRSGSEHHLIL